MGLTPEKALRPAPARLDRALQVWCLLRDQRGHVEPVEREFGDTAEFVYDDAWDPGALTARRPDVVLCVNEFHYDVARCLEAAKAVGIPSLLLQDGILEWRCQYENPLFAAGGGAPQHQPVLADKVACLGPSSARHIASWGNSAKVEVTGMPRLDRLAMTRFAPPARPGRRLLVMTAKKPWYDDSQRAVIERSLVELRDLLAGRSDLTVVWRVTRGLAEALGVENRLGQLETAELSSVLAEVDAVITTPSTAILESMLASRPVAVLDYFNVPRFVPTAWTISAPEHRASVVGELLDPPASRMLFQAECLRDALRCDGPAAPRVRALVEEMGRRARESASRNEPLRLPANLSRGAMSYAGAVLPPLAELYPGQPLLEESDVNVLRARLVRLEKDYERLRGGSLAERLRRRLRHLVRG